MYRLLIVDDEFNIRDGLANSVPWKDIGVEVVGTASDGREALELAGRVNPDIVISDISMAGMNGLEFIGSLLEIQNHVRFIILSGYSEFDYAIRAIELHVDSYLLKPVLPVAFVAFV